jgi:hypothetical protein
LHIFQEKFNQCVNFDVRGKSEPKSGTVPHLAVCILFCHDSSNNEQNCALHLYKIPVASVDSVAGFVNSVRTKQKITAEPHKFENYVKKMMMRKKNRVQYSMSMPICGLDVIQRLKMRMFRFEKMEMRASLSLEELRAL